MGEFVYIGCSRGDVFAARCPTIYGNVDHFFYSVQFLDANICRFNGVQNISISFVCLCDFGKGDSDDAFMKPMRHRVSTICLMWHLSPSLYLHMVHSTFYHRFKTESKPYHLYTFSFLPQQLIFYIFSQVFSPFFLFLFQSFLSSFLILFFSFFDSYPLVVVLTETCFHSYLT